MLGWSFNIRNKSYVYVYVDKHRKCRYMHMKLAPLRNEIRKRRENCLFAHSVCISTFSECVVIFSFI